MVNAPGKTGASLQVSKVKQLSYCQSHLLGLCETFSYLSQMLYDIQQVDFKQLVLLAA